MVPKSLSDCVNYLVFQRRESHHSYTKKCFWTYTRVQFVLYNMICIFILFFMHLDVWFISQTSIHIWYRSAVYSQYHNVVYNAYPDSKVRGANMAPIWGRQDPGGSHVGPMNFAIWVCFIMYVVRDYLINEYNQWVIQPILCVISCR